MKKLFLSVIVATIGFTTLSLAQTEYPNDMTTPSSPPFSKNPPTNPPTSSDNVSSTSSDGVNRPRGDMGMLLEPMLLTSQEDTTIKTSQLPVINNDTSGESTGYGVGLRLGAHASEVFLIGLDARYAKTEFKDSFYDRADGDTYNVAPFVGIQTPYMGIRLLAGYVVAGENNPEAGVQGLNLKFKEATGWRVGGGIYIAAVSLNVEYQDLTYNSTEVENPGVFSGTSSVDANNRGYTVSLSFPVEL